MIVLKCFFHPKTKDAGILGLGWTSTLNGREMTQDESLLSAPHRHISGLPQTVYTRLLDLMGVQKPLAFIYKH